MRSMVFKKKTPLFMFLIPAALFMLIYLYYPFVINVGYTFVRADSDSSSLPWEKPSNGRSMFIDSNTSDEIIPGGTEKDGVITGNTAMFGSGSVVYFKDGTKLTITDYNVLNANNPSIPPLPTAEFRLAAADTLELRNGDVYLLPGNQPYGRFSPNTGFEVIAGDGNPRQLAAALNVKSVLLKGDFTSREEGGKVILTQNGKDIIPGTDNETNLITLGAGTTIEYNERAGEEGEEPTTQDPLVIEDFGVMVRISSSMSDTGTFTTLPSDEFRFEVTNQSTGTKETCYYPSDGKLVPASADMRTLENVDHVVVKARIRYVEGDLFQNYKELFTNSNMKYSYRNTFIMMICTIIFQVGAAIVLAILVDTIPKGAQVFRTIYFFPIVISATALGCLFQIIFSNKTPLPSYYNGTSAPENLVTEPLDLPTGLLNSILDVFGINPVTWNEGNIAFVQLLFPVIWQYIGFYFVILATGLNDISGDIYEAAMIDGVTAFQKVRYITLPLLRNTICTCITLGITGALKVFDLPYILFGSSGGLGGKMHLLATYMNVESSTDIDFAATIAIMMVIMGVVISFLASKLFPQKDY